MANIFKKRTVCTTCNGEKTIICCSCGEQEGECQEFECPTCQGQGYLTEFNAPVMIAACAVGFALLVAIIMLL